MCLYIMCRMLPQCSAQPCNLSLNKQQTPKLFKLSNPMPLGACALQAAAIKTLQQVGGEGGGDGSSGVDWNKVVVPVDDLARQALEAQVGCVCVLGWGGVWRGRPGERVPAVCAACCLRSHHPGGCQVALALLHPHTLNY